MWPFHDIWIRKSAVGGARSWCIQVGVQPLIVAIGMEVSLVSCVRQDLCLWPRCEREDLKDFPSFGSKERTGSNKNTIQRTRRGNEKIETYTILIYLVLLGIAQYDEQTPAGRPSTIQKILPFCAAHLNSANGEIILTIVSKFSTKREVLVLGIWGCHEI